MFVYSLPPIDDWQGWMKAKGAQTNPFTGTDDLPEATVKYETFLKSALEAARKVGWEGDFREGPFVSVLPDPDNMGTTVYVGWKQDNNGTTFIVSPFPLPYLDAFT
jgi:hypothetical protein